MELHGTAEYFGGNLSWMNICRTCYLMQTDRNVEMPLLYFGHDYSGENTENEPTKNIEMFTKPNEAFFAFSA